MFASEHLGEGGSSRGRSPDYGSSEGSYNRKSRSPPRGGPPNDLEYGERSDRDYDRNDSGNHGYRGRGGGNFRGRGRGGWRGGYNGFNRDRDWAPRGGHAGGNNNSSNFRDRDSRDRDQRRSPSPPRTGSRWSRRDGDRSPPARTGDFTTRTFRAPDYDTPASKSYSRDSVSSPGASYGTRRYSGPNASSNRSPERRSYDDRDDTWRRSSSALDRDRDDYYNNSNRGGERTERSDFYSRRGGSYTGRSSYVPGSATSRDEYHTSSKDRSSAHSDEASNMDVDIDDDPVVSSKRMTRDREEGEREDGEADDLSAPPAKRPRVDPPVQHSELPPTPSIQPQAVRTSILAPVAPSTPTPSGPDPRLLAPLQSPGLFQVYTGRPQPITAPMQVTPAVSAPVAAPTLTASTAEALAAAREQKQQIVHDMNGKDDEISKLEKDIEQYRREMEKLGRELAGINASRAASNISLGADSMSSSSSSLKARGLTESTGSILAKLALNSSNSEGRLQLIRSLGPIFQQGEDVDLVQLILRKNRRTAFAAREGLRERLLGIRTDDIAVNTVFDQIPEDPEEYDRLKKLKNLPAGKVTRLYTQPKQLPFFEANRQSHLKNKAQMLSMLREKRKFSREQEKELREQYRKQWIRWKRKLRQRRQDEASERMIEALHARGGNPRRFPVRSLRVMQQESELKRRERQEKAKFQQYDDEEERFRRTEAKLPPMEVFDRRRGPVAQVHVVDNNRRIIDPAREEREYKSLHDWHAEEEAIFVKAYVKYPKDFEKIASFLPDKSVKDCIWFYYMSKFRLELKKRTQREGERNHIDLGLKSMEDPNDLTQLIAFGSVVDWTNGASRRGSLRLSEKGPINYSERNLEVAKPPGRPSSSFAPGSPVGRPGYGDDDGFRVGSPVSERIASPVHPSSMVEAVASPPPSDAALAGRWTPAEREQFKIAWEKYHKDWKAIASFMKTKDIAQVKNFYHNNKKKLHLLDPPSSSASSRSSSLRNPGAGGAAGDAGSASSDEGALLDVESDSNDANYSDLHPATSPVPVVAPASPVRRGGAARGRGGAIAGRGKAAAASIAAAEPPAPVEEKESSLPTTPSSHWTDVEKQVFKDQFVKHGKDWKSIAEALPSKTANQVKNFYQNYRIKLNLDSLRRQALEAASSAESALAAVKAEDESSSPAPSAAPTPTPVLDALMQTAEEMDAISPAPARRGGAKRLRGRGGKASGRGGKRTAAIKEEVPADTNIAVGTVDSDLRTQAAVALGSGVVLRRELTGSMESLDVNIDDDGVLSRSATPVPPAFLAAATPQTAAAESGPTLVAPKPQRPVAPVEPAVSRAVATRRNGSKRAKVDDSASTGSRSRRGTPNASFADDEDDFADDDEEPLGDDDRDQDFEATGTDEVPTVAPKESVAARAKRRRKEKPLPVGVVEEEFLPPAATAPPTDDAEMMEVDVDDDSPKKLSDKAAGTAAAETTAESAAPLAEDKMDVEAPNETTTADN